MKEAKVKTGWSVPPGLKAWYDEEARFLGVATQQLVAEVLEEWRQGK